MAAVVLVLAVGGAGLGACGGTESPNGKNVTTAPGGGSSTTRAASVPGGSGEVAWSA